MEEEENKMKVKKIFRQNKNKNITPLLGNATKNSLMGKGYGYKCLN